MYPEFIAIYAALAVLFIMLLVVLILVIKISKGAGSAPRPKYHGAAQAGSVVFCKNCAAQYNSSLRNCPKCGTPR